MARVWGCTLEWCHSPNETLIGKAALRMLACEIALLALRSEFIDMTYHPAFHHRRSIRLRDYDYAQAGWYFVTLCTDQRACLFGRIAEGQPQLSTIGQYALCQWQKLPTRFVNLELDAFVIMPNHMHGILRFTPEAATASPAQSADTRATLGRVIGAYKSRVFHDALAMVKSADISLGKIWQRNYWEHVVRSEAELEKIREYIQNNPRRWELDKLFVD